MCIRDSSRTFQPDQTANECVTIPIFTDNIPEEDERFLVVLSSNDSAVTPNSVTAEVVIENDERKGWKVL